MYAPDSERDGPISMKFLGILQIDLAGDAVEFDIIGKQSGLIFSL